jgi:hypothetical protein
MRIEGTRGWRRNSQGEWGGEGRKDMTKTSRVNRIQHKI